jgi:hypothetical protein
MIFKQNSTKTEPSFVYYRNNQIQNVSEYPFLGITLKSNLIALQISLKKQRKLYFV